MPRRRNARPVRGPQGIPGDRKSTRLNSSHTVISYAVFCLKKKKKKLRKKSRRKEKRQNATLTQQSSGRKHYEHGSNITSSRVRGCTTISSTRNTSQTSTTS